MTSYYVTTTDSFMSGWGPATGLTNKLIFPCDSYEKAVIVANNANARGDQKYVNICSSKPSYYRSTFGDDYHTGNYYVQIKTERTHPNWYTRNYFSN